MYSYLDAMLGTQRLTCLAFVGKKYPDNHKCIRNQGWCYRFAIETPLSSYSDGPGIRTGSNNDGIWLGVGWCYNLDGYDISYTYVDGTPA